MNAPRYERVLITGASSGLGAALARVLAARGHHVVLTARRDDRLSALRDTLRAANGRVDACVADLNRLDAARALVAEVEQRFGALDALINNAGASGWKPLNEWSPEAVIDCMNLNLLAPMLLTQAVLPGLMARRRGLIVNIASDLARRPLANMAPYVAAKHGLLGFAGSVLREAKAHGVKVTTVLPGIIDTEFNGAVEGSKEETWSLRPAALAEQVAAVFELPENVQVDELTVHPLQQDY